LHVYKDIAVRVPRKKLQMLLRTMSRHERNLRESNIVNLILTSHQRMRKLNSRFCAKNRATDVLSFSYADDTDGNIFGEVYIGVPIAQEQANRIGHSLSTEIITLTCHGLLHLAGYDHVKDNDYRKMRAKESIYLGMLERT
jgi:probable rRNA maturation factor